jgi:hypothetical protein
MSLKHLKIDSDVEMGSADTLPTRGDFTVPTGLHEMMITQAWMELSAGEAEGLKFTLKPADGSPQEVKDAFWVTSGKKKGKKKYFINSKGNKQALPGYVDAAQLAAIACGKKLEDLDEEEKVLKLWNSANQAEENTKVRWLPELVNKPVLAGILRVRDNKNRKEGDKWVPTADERYFNEVDKLFFPSGHSVTEKNAGADATFKDRWLKRFPEGETIDRYKEGIAKDQPDLPEEEQLTEEGITILFGTDN